MKTDIQKKIDFNQAVKDTIQFLDRHKYMSFATSSDDRVTSRTVTYVNDNLNIYFLSFEHHTKCTQIAKNPKVASSIDNLQIEGTATILGNALDKKNEYYANIFRKKLPDMFKMIAPKPRMILIKMEPSFFVTFVKKSGGVYLEHLDLNMNIAYVFEEL